MNSVSCSAFSSTQRKGVCCGVQGLLQRLGGVFCRLPRGSEAASTKLSDCDQVVCPLLWISCQTYSTSMTVPFQQVVVLREPLRVTLEDVATYPCDEGLWFPLPSVSTCSIPTFSFIAVVEDGTNASGFSGAVITQVKVSSSGTATTVPRHRTTESPCVGHPLQ